MMVLWEVMGLGWWVDEYGVGTSESGVGLVKETKERHLGR